MEGGVCEDTKGKPLAHNNFERLTFFRSEKVTTHGREQTKAFHATVLNEQNKLKQQDMIQYLRCSEYWLTTHQLHGYLIQII